VRDTLTVDPDTPALEIAREPLVLEPSASAYDALARMRRGRVQLATVVAGEQLLGVVTLDDLLREILPGPGELAAAQGGSAA
jgi:CBS domain containing-hemolysin-like protein